MSIIDFSVDVFVFHFKVLYLNDHYIDVMKVSMDIESHYYHLAQSFVCNIIMHSIYSVIQKECLSNRSMLCVKNTVAIIKLNALVKSTYSKS